MHPVPGLIVGDNDEQMDIKMYRLNLPRSRFNEKKIKSSKVTYFMCIVGSSRGGGSSNVIKSFRKPCVGHKTTKK